MITFVSNNTREIMQEENMLLEVVRLILPTELVDYFKITGVSSVDGKTEIELDEFPLLPVERQGHKVESKGFLTAVSIQDFSVRNKRLTFKVRRRKWYDVDTGEYFTNSYDFVAEGTRYSKEFAAFLKGILGDSPCIGSLA